MLVSWQFLCQLFQTPMLHIVQEQQLAAGAVRANSNYHKATNKLQTKIKILNSKQNWRVASEMLSVKQLLAKKQREREASEFKEFSV